MNSKIYSPAFQFRAPEVTQKQLKQLTKIWGTNRSQVILRCIDRIWSLETSNLVEEKRIQKQKSD